MAVLTKGGVGRLLAHGKFVRSLARALVADALADDVVQGTWLAAAIRRRIGSASRAGATCRDQRRAEAPAWPVAAGAFRASRRHTSSTADRCRGGLQRTDVIDAVRSLDNYRTVIVLRFFEEQSAREIACRLEMPVASVRTRLQRAVELLRETLTARNGGDEQRWLAAVVPLAWPHAAVGAGAVAWAGGAIAAAAALLWIAPIGSWWRHGQAAPAAAGAIATPQHASVNAAAIASTPQRGDTRAPQTRRENTSRPSSSVPNR